MADIKLIALDLDGTLLTTDKRLTDRTKETLKAARDRGIKVVLTTGRPLKAMDFFLHELGTDGQEDEYTITNPIGPRKSLCQIQSSFDLCSSGL